MQQIKLGNNTHPSKGGLGKKKWKMGLNGNEVVESIGKIWASYAGPNEKVREKKRTTFVRKNRILRESIFQEEGAVENWGGGTGGE